jgi:hypothetical protein
VLVPAEPGSGRRAEGDIKAREQLADLAAGVTLAFVAVGTEFVSTACGADGSATNPVHRISSTWSPSRPGPPAGRSQQQAPESEAERRGLILPACLTSRLPAVRTSATGRKARPSLLIVARTSNDATDIALPFTDPPLQRTAAGQWNRPLAGDRVIQLRATHQVPRRASCQRPTAHPPSPAPRARRPRPCGCGPSGARSCQTWRRASVRTVARRCRCWRGRHPPPPR